MALAYFQRIEWSKVNVPLDTLARLAVAFDVDVAQLLQPVAPADVIPKNTRVDHGIREK